MEIKLFRNLPFHKVLKYFIIGGGTSLFVAILYYSLPFFEQKTATLNFGGALMYVKGFDKLDKKHLNGKSFLLICIIPLVLHWLWDLPIQAPFELFRVGLTTPAWVVIIYFINLGLKQIDDAKKLEKEQVKK